jgi:hypothetical protein
MGGGNARPRTTNHASKSKSKNIKSSDKSQQTTLTSGKKRNVFISFHMEDEAQIKLLRHQAKNEKFNLEFHDYSVKKPFDNKWKTRCEERIKQTSVTMVMIGPETYKRPAVLWEINKSYQLGKKVIGVRIRKDKHDPIPGPLLRHKAEIVNWKLEDIQKELDKK